MARLFAENFVIPPLEPEQEQPEPIYDEERSLSLDPAGRVFVELRVAGDTHTLTEVRAEQEDRDVEDDVAGRTETFTKVQGERPDIPRDEFAVGTDTRQAGEREDRIRAAVELGTKTSVPNERDDFTSFVSWAETRTLIQQEGTDFPQAGGL